MSHHSAHFHGVVFLKLLIIQRNSHGNLKKVESVHEGGKRRRRESCYQQQHKVSRVRKFDLAHVLPRSNVCFCLNQRRLSSPDIRYNAERLLTAFTPVMSGVISLKDRLFISDASTSDSFQRPPSIPDEASPRRGKSTIVVAGCIFFCLRILFVKLIMCDTQVRRRKVVVHTCFVGSQAYFKCLFTPCICWLRGPVIASQCSGRDQCWNQTVCIL